MRVAKQNLYSFLKYVFNNILLYGVPANSVEKFQYCTFDDLIADEKTSIDFILSCLEYKASVPSINRHRASHIIVNWLLGIGIDKALNIPEKEGFQHLYSYQIWLQTSMIHDYGYFCNETGSRKTTLFELSKGYDLLSDVYDPKFLQCLNHLSKNQDFENCFTYSYELLKNYFFFSIDLHKDDDEQHGVERVDHGIAGACIAFRKYCENIVQLMEKDFPIYPSNCITKIVKIACVVTASHNLYKSDNTETDIKYRAYGLDELLSTAPIAISCENKHLFLLSIVDTIECTKRFSKRTDSSKYLLHKTILKNVDIEIVDSGITIDFTRLYEYLKDIRKDTELQNRLNGHIEAIGALQKWVDVTVSVRERCIHISMPYE